MSTTQRAGDDAGGSGRDDPGSGDVAGATAATGGRAGGPTTTQFRFGARPTIGAATALRAVAEDTSALVRAEIELAKAELRHGVQANAIGIGLLVGAGVLGWLGLQGLLITAGFALALVVPGWAAALIVTGVLLVIAAVLALVARNKLGTPVSVDQARANIQEDVQWFKTHLRGR